VTTFENKTIKIIFIIGHLGCALAEATAIYGFVIGLLIIIMLG